MKDRGFRNTLKTEGLTHVTAGVLYDAWHMCLYAEGPAFDALSLDVQRSIIAVCHYLEVLEFLIRLWRRILRHLNEHPLLCPSPADRNKLFAFIREFCWTASAYDGIQRRADSARMAQVAATLGQLREVLPSDVTLTVQAATFDPNVQVAVVSDVDISQTATKIKQQLVAAVTRKV